MTKANEVNPSVSPAEEDSIAAEVSWHVLTISESIQALALDQDMDMTANAAAAAAATTADAYDSPETTHLKRGLSSAQAALRLDKFGPNKLSEGEKETIWQKIWKQVSNVLVCILVIVAAFAAARAILEMTMSGDKDPTTILTNWVQVGLITLVITVNTFIGILQEGSAQKAAEALKNMLSADAHVIRDGVEQLIPAQDVVPGDMVVLSLGDRVPADLRMTEVTNLACQEAALTGESVPIDKTTARIVMYPDQGNKLGPTDQTDKDQSNNTDATQHQLLAEQIPLGDRHNMCFSATLVAQGSGVGVATSTGDYTQIGTINKLVAQVEKKKTNVLEQIDQVSKLLAVLIGLATLSTFFVARYRTGSDWFDAVSMALVCCVAMVPEGLEAIVTLTYAWAVTNMAHQNAIIRSLPAVETLGSVSVICSDKTGTLTQNVMSLVAFVSANARYRFDVNSVARKPANFVRDDAYLAHRAQHQQRKPIASVLRDGANSGARRRGLLDSSNHFAIDGSLHSRDENEQKDNNNDKDNEYTSESVPVSDYPFSDGESPSLAFVQSVLAGGVLCSKCVLGRGGTREGEIGNPTELSILRAAYFSGVDVEALKVQAPTVAEVPFSSEYKFMATVHAGAAASVDEYVVHVKGAPDRMIKLCVDQASAGVVGETEPMNESYWIEQIAVLSSHGLRVLGLCRASVPRTTVEAGASLGPEFVDDRVPQQWLTMVGLCAIMDPPRPECVRAIQEAQGAGVRVAMITGDHKDTATAIGRMLGIVNESYSSAVVGTELDEMDDEQIKRAVMEHNVFARASPQNKIRIVKALQAQGQISSMTGDGVNDAPALKAADIGVAMGKEGTDVAREASEMILADDNFSTIVTAIREGRVVWDNLRKVLLVNTPINNSQGMSVLFGLLFGLEKSPLSPIQVLYSNLICAITLGFVTAIEPAEDGIMDLPPRRVGKRLIGRYLLLRILIGTFTLTALVVSSAFWLQSYNDVYGQPYTYYHVRALAFNVLDFGAISVALSARFSYNSSFHPRIFRNNKYCWYSVFIVAFLQLAITYIPVVNKKLFMMESMDGKMWTITVLFMTIMFIVMEVEKAIRRYLKFTKGADTDDRHFDSNFDSVRESEGMDINVKMPKGASKLNLVTMDK